MSTLTASKQPLSYHKVVIVTGASRGLGKGFVEHFLLTLNPHQLLTPTHFCDQDYTVIALCRHEKDAKSDLIWGKLKDDVRAWNDSMQEEDKSLGPRRHLVTFPCDVTNLTQIQSLVEFIKRSYNSRVDLLISNAGINEDNPQSSINDLLAFTPETTQIIQTNSLAPIIITNHLSPFLINAHETIAMCHGEDPRGHIVEMVDPDQECANQKDNTTTTISSLLSRSDQTDQYAQCLYVSSDFGSISLLNAPLTMSYRISKAALNMGARALSLSYPQINILIIHPGWVATDMGSRGGRTPPVKTSESIEGMLKVAKERCNVFSSAKCLVSYDGSVLPW